MFFRNLLNWIWIVAGLSLAIVGCGRKNLPSGVDSMEMGSEETSCLKGAMTVFDRYVDGQSNDQEISRVWNCAIRSLQLFTERTRGQTAGVYTALELRAFLEKYFLDGERVSDDLLREMMEIKRVLIGGDENGFTLDEMARTRELIGVFRDQSLKLRPFMPLTPEGVVGRTNQQLDAANQAILQVAAKMGEVLSASRTGYSFNHVNRLLDGMELYSRSSLAGLLNGEEPMAARIKRQMPLALALRALVLPSHDEDAITPTEWPVIMETGAKWYGLLLKVEGLGARHESWTDASARDDLLNLGREGFELVKAAILRQPYRQIPFDMIDRLIDLLYPEGSIEVVKATETSPARSILTSHLKDFLRPMVRRWMGGRERGAQGRAATGLTIGAMDGLWKVAETWVAGQRYLDGLFQAAANLHSGGVIREEGYTADQLRRVPFVLVGSILSGRSVQQIERSARNGNRHVPVPVRNAMHVIGQILEHERPLFLKNDPRVTIAGYPGDLRHSLHGMQHYNWMFTLGKVLIDAYSEDPERRSLSFEEFKHFVDDIYPIGIDLMYFDPNDPIVAEKRFREANLFTYAGDGDAFFSVREAANLLALMLSGKDLAYKMHEEIAKVCPTGELDPFGYVTIDTPCYRRQIRSNYRHYWQYLPRLVSFFDRLDEPGRDQFVHSMEDAARKAGFSNVKMNSADSEGLGTLPQYLEIIFARYDQDGSGDLNLTEADLSFPIFKGTLMELAAQMGHEDMDSDRKLRTVFTYMLTYGEAPTAMQYIGWKFKRWERLVHADRQRIMGIFGMIGKPAAPATD